jgi:hypothetical protein
MHLLLPLLLLLLLLGVLLLQDALWLSAGAAGAAGADGGQQAGSRGVPHVNSTAAEKFLM